MVIIKISRDISPESFCRLSEQFQIQAKHGCIVLPIGCELLYASDGPAGKVYTIRKDGVICDTSNQPGCGYTDKELQQLQEAGFDLYYGEEKTEWPGNCRGPVCLRWRECQGTGVETCPL